MKKGLFKKLPILLLLIALIFTFGFITGFIKPDSEVADNVRVPLLNVGEEEEEEEAGEVGSYLAHLNHVIAMRMKHLAVLQRVLEAKDPGQHSVFAINHAIVQSSKSILKMQEIISASLNGGTGDGNNTDTTEEEVENKGKGNKKDKGEKSNKGKAKGKIK